MLIIKILFIDKVNSLEEVDKGKYIVHNNQEVSKEFMDLLCRCLSYESTFSLSMEEIFLEIP